MLDLRPSCECCDHALLPESPGAMICTSERTFCRECVTDTLKGVFPHYGGNFVPRNIRAFDKLACFPASAKRVFNPEGCAT